MNLPAADHPVWPIIRNLIVLGTLGLCLAYGYSTFDPFKDIRSMLIVGLCLGGFDFLKKLVVPKANHETAV